MENISIWSVKILTSFGLISSYLEPYLANDKGVKGTNGGIFIMAAKFEIFMPKILVLIVIAPWIL